MDLQVFRSEGQFYVRERGGATVRGPYNHRPNADRFVRDRREQAAREAAKAEGAKKRPCMCCDKPFESTWIGHRMCDPCRRKPEGLI